MESTIDSASVFSSSSLLNMLLLSTKVPECNVEAIEWNWSGILLTPDLADTKEWPDPLCRMEEGFSIGSSAHDRNSSWAIDEPPGTRLEDEDFDTYRKSENSLDCNIKIILNFRKRIFEIKKSHWNSDLPS